MRISAILGIYALLRTLYGPDTDVLDWLLRRYLSKALCGTAASRADSRGRRADAASKLSRSDLRWQLAEVPTENARYAGS